MADSFLIRIMNLKVLFVASLWRVKGCLDPMNTGSGGKKWSWILKCPAFIQWPFKGYSIGFKVAWALANLINIYIYIHHRWQHRFPVELWDYSWIGFRTTSGWFLCILKVQLNLQAGMQCWILTLRFFRKMKCSIVRVMLSAI